MYDTNNELDPIAYQVLLCLSGGNRLILADITNLLKQPLNLVWRAVQILMSNKMIQHERGKYFIAEGGIEYLSRQGVSAAQPLDEPDPKDYRNKFKLPLFGTFEDMGLWLIAPVFLLIVDLTFMGYFIADHSDDFWFKLFIVAIGIAVFGALFVLYTVKSYHNVMETEKLVVFRSGKSKGTKGPGHVLVLPFIDHLKTADLREISKEVKEEVCLTKDKLPLILGFMVTWKVDDAVLSLTKVSNANDSILLLATSILRTEISEFPLVEALDKRKAVAHVVKVKLENRVADWGIEIKNLEIREIQPSKELIRTYEERVKANWEKETTITNTDAEVEALRKLFAIGSQLDQKTLNLKYMETLKRLGEGASTKFVFPMEFISLLENWLKSQSKDVDSNSGNGNMPARQLPPSDTQNT